MPENDLAVASHQLCTFRLEDHLFCVDAQSVQEVIRFQDMTRVPLTEPHVSGLINLRGQIVTAIDMRKRLAFPDFPEGQMPMNVVIRTDDGPVSLLVDRIGDVADVDSANYESAPSTLCNNLKRFVAGAFKLDQHLLLLLDINAVVGDTEN